MTGIININKPCGFTSSDVVVILKKVLGIKRIGHLGTLDPMASGVLPICIGKATRLFDFYLNKTKTYIAQFKFGILTDTLDAEGTLLQKSGQVPAKEAILKALGAFVGRIEQFPPKYSAKSVNGTRAYKLARKGQEFELNSKLVDIIKFELINQISDDTFEFEIECGSGTYIRSLCRDLAEKLKTVATMTSLIRIRCGNFDIINAVNDFKNKSRDILTKSIIPLDKALSSLNKLELNDDESYKLTHGIGINYYADEDDILLLSKGEVVGIGKSQNGILKISVYLKEDL